MVRRDRRRRFAAEEAPGEPERRIGALVGAPDVAGPGGDAAVADMVEVGVVERRIGGAVGEGRRDQPEELVLELIRRRVAGEEEIGLPGPDDVAEERLVERLEPEPLLDVGRLRDDPGLGDREVGAGRGRERPGDVLLEVA